MSLDTFGVPAFSRMILRVTVSILCLLAGIGFSASASGAVAEPGAEVQEYAALPDAPSPADTDTLIQFGGGPGSVGRKIPVPLPAPALQSCMPNASSANMAKMSCAQTTSPFARFLKSPQVAPMTPKDKFILATKDTFDPFNLMTIVADAAIAVASDSHGVYGPGVQGIAKYSGVSFTENMTGEYFGTFFVCSVMHQDPHYHREPNMPIKHRIIHSITQVVWTQSDTGAGMFNYANFVGGVATAVVSNTFVPGPGRQGWSSTSQRLALAFATSPSGNLITEFLPDVASRVNLHVVIFQRILNMVTNEDGGQ